MRQQQGRSHSLIHMGEGLLLIGIGKAHQIDLLSLFYVIPVLLGMKPLLHRNQLLFLLVILVVLMNHILLMVGMQVLLATLVLLATYKA